MALNPGDLEKVPQTLSMRQCYERIHGWHRSDGVARLEQRYGGNDAYAQSYRDLLSRLPAPAQATEADMAFVFNEVITNRMEWAYHQEDERGIKTAAYAHFALQRWFGDDLARLQEVARGSPLSDKET